MQKINENIISVNSIISIIDSKVDPKVNPKIINVNSKVIDNTLNSAESQQNGEGSIKNNFSELNNISVVNNSNYDTIVLSGGSIKGFMILGAIHYLETNYLLNNIKTYIGTSIGSIISYLLAIGYTSLEIMLYISTNQIFDKLRNFNIVAIFNGGGAISFSPIQECIEKMTINKIGKLLTMKGLYDMFGKKLICVTYNNTKDCTEYLSYINYPDLPCLTALRMSSNLPLIFDTFKYMNCDYIDGGISDTFAIKYSENFGEKILGIYIDTPDTEKLCLKTKENTYSLDSDKGILEYIYKLIFIPVKQAYNFKIQLTSKKCTIVRLISNIDIKVFEFNISIQNRLDLFSLGYQQIKEIEENKC
jgi:predicted acylesterase/phospholipase RssA